MTSSLFPAWLRWTLLAMISWAAWAVLSKLPGDAITAGQSQALSTLGLLPMIPFLRKAGLRGASPRGLWLALAGGVLTCIGNVAYYELLARGGKVATVVALTALYPLVTVLLALVILRERLNVVQWCGIPLSFVALWLFNIQGGGGLFSITAVHALLPILLWGLSGFLQKLSTGHVSAETAAAVYLASFVPVGIFYALREQPWPTVSPTIWAVVTGMGFFLAFGNFAILAAFSREGKASVIAPLASLYPLLGIPAAVLFLGERVGLREIAGIAAALVSVVALSWEAPPKQRTASSPPSPDSAGTS